MGMGGWPSTPMGGKAFNLLMLRLGWGQGHIKMHPLIRKHSGFILEQCARDPLLVPSSFGNQIVSRSWGFQRGQSSKRERDSSETSKKAAICQLIRKYFNIVITVPSFSVMYHNWMSQWVGSDWKAIQTT